MVQLQGEKQDVLMPGILPMTWLAYAAEQGMPVADLVREVDLVREEADSFASGAPLSKLAALTQAVIRRSTDPAIGIEIGWRLPLTSFGALGHAMLSSATVGDALLVCQRFWHLFGPDLILHVSLHDDLLVASVTPLASVHGQFRRVTVEAALTTVYRGVHALTPEGATAAEIWFDYPEPDYGARIREKIPGARFGMPILQCRMPALFLQRPLPMASAVGRHVAIQQLELREKTLGFHGPLSAKVQMRLGFDATGYPSLEQTAEVLHMTERTLRRRLQDEGTSYSTLLDEARRRDAVRLLGNPNVEIGTIAERLGYNDSANFTRAFRKWAGMAPSQFRGRAGRK
ncbi:MAG: AraC family transcriptional regulator ligand-binding domain-containing protein [Panacagrimonas sp.]